MIIAIDFDGTIVEHQFPEIGNLLPYAIDAIKALKKNGHQLILWTCRNDHDPANNGRMPLTEAVEFLNSHGVEFDAINDNVDGLGFNPWPKIYADVYIDDKSLGGQIDWFEIIHNYDLGSFVVKKVLILEYFERACPNIHLKTRKRQIVEYRQLCMYTLKQLTKYSLAEIGSMVGEKNHATVLHAVKTVTVLMSDKRYMSQYGPIFNHFKLDTNG